MTDREVLARASKVRMIVLDVDGVMTDGRVYYSDEGAMFKAFDIRDGFGIVLARRAGIEFAIITGQRSRLVEHRAAQLGIEELHQGFMNKADILSDILLRHHLEPQQAAFMGDDLFDLTALCRVGLSAAPRDAHEEVKAGVHWVSRFTGGRGAVRELIELVMKARGIWDRALAEFDRI